MNLLFVLLELIEVKAAVETGEEWFFISCVSECSRSREREVAAESELIKLLQSLTASYISTILRLSDEAMRKVEANRERRRFSWAPTSQKEKLGHFNGGIQLETVPILEKILSNFQIWPIHTRHNRDAIHRSEGHRCQSATSTGIWKKATRTARMWR